MTLPLIEESYVLFERKSSCGQFGRNLVHRTGQQREGSQGRIVELFDQTAADTGSLVLFDHGR